MDFLSGANPVRVPDWSQIVEGIPEPVALLDGECRVIYLNGPAREYAGLPAGEVLGQSLWQIWPEVTGSEFRTCLDRAVRENTGTVCQTFDSRQGIWLEHRIVPSAGNVLIFARDITTQRKQERQQEQLQRELSRQRDDFDTLMQIAPVGLAIADDAECGVIRSNPLLGELLGAQFLENISYSQPERSRIPYRLLRPDGTEFAAADLPMQKAAREQRVVAGVELTVERPDGSRVTLWGSAAPLLDETGQVRGSLGAFQDVTALAGAQQALAASNQRLQEINADLRQFAYAASHDLQEPLRMVTAYSQLLSRRYSQVVDEGGEQILEYITTGAIRIERLLRDLREYWQVTGDDEPVMETIAATAPLDQALRNLESRLTASAATVTVGDLPKVRGSEVALVQLFQNLVSNAIKYRRPDEPPRIRISAVKEDEGWWRFSVRDNGLGIAPEHHQRVFGLFRRLHGTKYPGTGIGLTMCKKIVERHGGRIWVQSELGAGTEFLFTLPAVG